MFINFSFISVCSKKGLTICKTILQLSSFIIIIIIIITAVEFSLDGNSPYTSTDKTNNIHKLDNSKIQYKHV